jgi:redox-sensitive bicupin YhaK (pirin superfamily)
MAAQLTPNDILEALAKVLSPKSETSKDVKDRILSIDGRVSTEVVTMAEAEKVAKQLAPQGKTVKVYVYEGELSVDMPVAIKAAKAATQEAEGVE